MKVTLLAGILACMTIAAPALGRTTGAYKIPSGQYLDRDVVLTSPKVNVRARPDGTIKLDYKLPREIDGAEPRTISLESINLQNPTTLTGPEASAICEPVDAEFSCTVSYLKNDQGVFAINTESANRYMQARNFSPARKELMGRAQQSIMHEAVGILFIKNR